ncbi:MAG: tetraacyldisaccharide 4'-kinase [Gammaproteobacteria bacterium]|nr:tetraacyldisaccharide 4'-kinase [Gammaproteobacteria bacterium]
MQIRQWVENKWYSKSPGLLWALYPLEILVRLFTRAKLRHRNTSLVVDTPVMVVGNVTVGGTGKTPLIAALAQHYIDSGLRVAIIARGYNSDVGQSVIEVDPSHSTDDVGDEPKLLANRGFKVFVSQDRYAAAEVAANVADLVISDDGLQHYRLPRRFEVCVVDGKRVFGNGRLLPMGPLRESVSRLNYCDAIIINTGAKPSADALINFDVPVFCMSITVDGFYRINDGTPCSPPIAAPVVSGIGNPSRFYDSLRSLGVSTDVVHEFDDHHRYSDADLMQLQGPFVTTEKDAVKLRGRVSDDAVYLRIGANLDKLATDHFDLLMTSVKGK